MEYSLLICAAVREKERQNKLSVEIMYMLPRNAFYQAMSLKAISKTDTGSPRRVVSAIFTHPFLR
jgi:hypothetical protein